MIFRSIRFLCTEQFSTLNPKPWTLNPDPRGTWTETKPQPFNSSLNTHASTTTPKPSTCQLYTLNPAPCCLHPISCTLHPTPCSLHPTSCTLHPTPASPLMPTRAYPETQRVEDCTPSLAQFSRAAFTNFRHQTISRNSKP